MRQWMIPLEGKSKIPMYQQICGYFKKEIQNGRMKAGEKLPSSRLLAKNLCVSRSTVDLAYDQLLSEGYVESWPCKGYYVCDIQGLYFMPESTPEEEKKAGTEDKGKENSREKAEKKGLENRDGKEPPKGGEKEKRKLIDFALNGIAPGGFPYPVWKKLDRQVLSQEEEDLFSLGDSCGEPGIRQAVAEYLYQARGVQCSPGQIVIGAGNDYLLLLLGTILGRNRKIAMESPTYLSAYYDFLHMGYQIEAVGQDMQGISVKELQACQADTVYVMPSHQFPMGMVMPLKRRTALLSWANEKEGRYIIEDDYDSEFRYKGLPIPALQGFDRQGKVIYLGTFSKSLAPSVRISYMVLPGELMDRYLSQGHPFSVTVSKTDQKIVELFMREGHFERHLNRMRAVYKGKHDLMVKGLRQMSHICTYAGENAGVHMALEFVNGLTESQAVERAKRAGIQVYGLSQYQILEKEKNQEKNRETVLLGYATLRDEEIEQGLEMLKNLWEK